MSLPLLLIAILVLFLLRVPMAFAILGPSMIYLLVEDYTLHLGVRVDHAGDQQLAAACRSAVHHGRDRGHPIGDRRSALRRGPPAPRPAAGRPGLREHRREPWLLVDERCCAGRRGRDRRDRGRPHAEEGLPGRVLGRPERELGADQPDHAAQHPRRRLRVGRRGVDRRPVRRRRHPGAAHDGGAGGDGVPVVEAASRSRRRAVQLGGHAARRHPSDPADGSADHHPRRHPGRILHPDRGCRHRRALHAAAGAVVPDDAHARRRADLPRHGGHQRPDHDHHRGVRAAQLDPRARAGAADGGAGPAGR